MGISKLSDENKRGFLISIERTNVETNEMKRGIVAERFFSDIEKNLENDLKTKVTYLLDTMYEELLEAHNNCKNQNSYEMEKVVMILGVYKHTQDNMIEVQRMDISNLCNRVRNRIDLRSIFKMMMEVLKRESFEYEVVEEVVEEVNGNVLEEVNGNVLDWGEIENN